MLFVNAISKPMASRKLTKKIYKLIKKASKERTKNIINGLKDVQTRIRKGDRGITIFAGDVYPIDIMCHLPAVCEEKDIMYCFTPSRQDLGVAMGVKRGSIALMIKENADYQELYDELKDELKTLPHPF
jgi:H/ACA ribonucleoprotein complex subunit 2